MSDKLCTSNKTLSTIEVVSPSQNINAKLEKLSCDVEVLLAYSAFREGIKGLEAHKFELAIDRSQHQFYLISDDRNVLKYPLSTAKEIKGELDVIKKLLAVKEPLFVDGKFNWRSIYADGFFTDTEIYGVQDNKTSQLERQKQIETANNRVEELARFVFQLRQNSKDSFAQRVITDGKVGFETSPYYQQLSLLASQTK